MEKFMNLNDFLKTNSRNISEELMNINNVQLKSESISGFGMKNKIIELIHDLMAAMFPTVYELEITEDVYILETINRNIIDATVKLHEILKKVLTNQCNLDKKSTCQKTECFIKHSVFLFFIILIRRVTTQI